MELLHGVTLRDVLADPSDKDVERRLDLLERALEPLSEAHARGLVHGDLTPSNLFEIHAVGREGDPAMERSERDRGSGPRTNTTNESAKSATKGS